MKLTQLILPALSIAGVLLLGSCKKNYTPSPDSTSIVDHFEVDFNASTLNINNVDSVTVAYTIGTQTTIKKMQKGTGVYNIDNVTLSNTPNSVSISVYTSTVDPTGQGDPSSGRIFVYDISGNDTFKLTGPSVTNKDNWKPRVIIVDNVHHVQFTFGENPDDPYFSIKADNPTIWTEMSIIRDASNNTNYLGGTVFTVPLFTNGSNIITNTTGFAAYAYGMHNQAWTSGSILLYMGYPGNPYTVQLYYQYDSRN